MSMTWWIPEAPTNEVRQVCMCAQDAPSFDNDDPNWDELALHAWDDCGACKGTGCLLEQASTAPEINMSNANCRDVTELLGLGREEGGIVKPENAAAVLRRALKAMNVSGQAESLARDPIEDGRMFVGGTTAESVRWRLRGIIEVLKYAVEHKQRAVWG